MGFDNKPILISKTLNNYNLEIKCEAMNFERGGVSDGVGPLGPLPPGTLENTDT